MNTFYFSRNLAVITFIMFSSIGFSQNTKPTWTKISKEKALEGKVVSGKHKQSKVIYYELKLEDIKPILINASKQKSIETSNAIITLPNSEGTMESYKLIEASILDTEFQKKHPSIQTFEGESNKDKGTKIRLSLTPQGLHAMILNANNKTEFIDPVDYGSNNYVVYKKADLKNIDEGFTCYFKDDSSAAKTNTSLKSTASLNANDGILRTYELALACTVEYSAYHINLAGLNNGTDQQKKDAVLSAMVVTMNRVNGIFKRDLSLTMTLIDNTSIIFLYEPDGYTNNNGEAMLTENQSIIDANIGSANYDIGHVFSTGGGGLASVNSPCVSTNKAKGVTGLTSPIGDVFDVEFVTHEMGHQFGAEHTWSASSGNCTTAQWSTTSSYEPGSGSTIMGYAGLCTPQNVQANGDDYFHQKSLQMIWANITNGNSSGCDTETSTGNSAPSANAGNNYSIPISTPYKLTGSSSDPDGTNTHTYNWEQYDLASSQITISESNATGALVRSIKPSTSPVRYIPNLPDLLITGGSTNWEKLPSVSRTMNFQFTVRDNDSRGGQTATDNMSISVINTGSAFEITSQNTASLSYPSGSTQTVTWNVSGTASAPINTSKVNIKLSTDGGLTYNTTLLALTDNDGSADITFPQGVTAAFCRIMIEADPNENIFFAINKEDFALGYTISKTCNEYAGGSNLPLNLIDNNNSLQTSVINVNETNLISDINVGIDVTHPYIGDLQVSILSPEGTQIDLITQGLCSSENNLKITFDDDTIDDINCSSTNNNEIYKPVEALSSLNNENPFGNWTLGIADLASGDTGTLNAWTIEVCYTTITLDDNNFNTFEKNVAVYPNPNNGEFRVTFKNTSARDTNLMVYDLNARLIFSKNYNNVVDFNEVISLSHLQSGMYILNINDGLATSTKKIIIK